MKQILINCEELETRLALLEDGKLERYKLERNDDESIVGNIYKGKIVNLEPSLEAAFVDIGVGKNAFLHYWDMLNDSLEKEIETDMSDISDNNEEPEEVKIEKKLEEKLPEEKSNGMLSIIKNFFSNKKEEVIPDLPKTNYKKQNRNNRNKRRPTPSITKEDIPDLYPPNKTILVQVTKGAIGTKGPRISTNISIPGRYLVFLPNTNLIAVSRKIDDNKERTRIIKILKSLKKPKNMGCICRTVGRNMDAQAFQTDMDMLMETCGNLFDDIQKKAPVCVYEEPNLIERSIRDFLTEDIDEIIVDSPKEFKYIQKRLATLSKKERGKVILYNKAQPLFQNYKVHTQVDNIFIREVQLPSGGYICIDETEALIAIDINSGKSRRGKDHPETILNTNMEAAEEISRQCRLRNIGGLVVIDFIDMRSRRDQGQIFKTMKKANKKDSAKTSCLPISRFGLMEMTRQREDESLLEAVYDPCPYCSGKGKVKSALSVSVEIHRRLRELFKRRKNANIRILVNEKIQSRLKNEDNDLLKQLEKDFGGHLSFRIDSAIHIEEFKIIDLKTGREIR